MNQTFMYSYTEHKYINGKRQEDKKPKDRLVFEGENKNDNPGPGAYNQQEQWKDEAKITIKDRAETKYLSNTANIDYLPQPRIETKAKTIGSRRSCEYFIKNDNPLSCAVLPSTLKRPCTKIGSRIYKDYDNQVPGPGTYLPKYKDSKIGRSLNYGERSPLWTKPENIPGPGYYDTTKPLQPPKRWAQSLRGVKPKKPVKSIDRFEHPEHYKKEFKFIRI